MSARWLAGVVAGIVLGLGAVLAIEGATDDASAQANFAVTPEQLRINQRISQAAVRRSNESLNLLDPVRKSGAQDDAPGWGTTQIRDGAVTDAKLSGALRDAQPRWAVVAATTGALVRGRGVTSSAKLATPGFYTVTFDRDVTQCGIQVTIAAGDTTVTPVGQVSAWHTPDTPTTITVRTAQDAESGADQGEPQDVNTLPFHASVLC